MGSLLEGVSCVVSCFFIGTIKGYRLKLHCYVSDTDKPGAPFEIHSTSLTKELNSKKIKQEINSNSCILYPTKDSFLICIYRP